MQTVDVFETRYLGQVTIPTEILLKGIDKTEKYVEEQKKYLGVGRIHESWFRLVEQEKIDN